MDDGMDIRNLRPGGETDLGADDMLLIAPVRPLIEGSRTASGRFKSLLHVSRFSSVQIKPSIDPSTTHNFKCEQFTPKQ
jgi:hypothetical protein